MIKFKLKELSKNSKTTNKNMILKAYEKKYCQRTFSETPDFFVVFYFSRNFFISVAMFEFNLFY